MLHETTMFLAVDGNGGEAVSLESAAEALDLLREDSESDAFRVTRITVHAPLPQLGEVDVELPASEEEPVAVHAEKATQELEPAE